jgi:hypothetical protein
MKHYHEDIWGSGGIAPPFLTSALDEGEWSVSRYGHFTSGERASGTHCWKAGRAPESVWTLYGGLKLYQISEQLELYQILGRLSQRY